MTLTYETTDFRGSVAPYNSNTDVYTSTQMSGTWTLIDGRWYRDGARPARRYGYALAPKYLSLTTWTFNARGERLRSDRFTPSAGLSHRERYDACATMIKNVGLTPPPYLP